MSSIIHSSLAQTLPVPRRPRTQVPKGACDCHAHVFGPYALFPLEAQRTYSPAEAPLDSYLKVLDTLGFERGVLVQPSPHGLDNRALIAALQSEPDQLRGVAAANAGTSVEQLHELHAAGVRGLRFSRLLDASGERRYLNSVDIGELNDLAPKMREVGLHAQLWLGVNELPQLEPTIRSSGLSFVIDHLGRCDPSDGLQHPGFELMCDLMLNGNLWVKLTPYRPSSRYPDYDDIRPFHEQLLRVNPNRLIWGSDWPHVNMERNVPDAGHLLDVFSDWTRDTDLIKRILVDNPAKLYDF